MAKKKDNFEYSPETDPDLDIVRRNLEFNERVNSADTPDKFAELQEELGGGEPGKGPSVAPGCKASSKASPRGRRGRGAEPYKHLIVAEDVHERFTLAKTAYGAATGRGVGASLFLSKVLDAALPVLFEDPEEMMRLVRRIRRTVR